MIWYIRYPKKMLTWETQPEFVEMIMGPIEQNITKQNNCRKWTKTWSNALLIGCNTTYKCVYQIDPPLPVSHFLHLLLFTK